MTPEAARVGIEILRADRFRNMPKSAIPVTCPNCGRRERMMGLPRVMSEDFFSVRDIGRARVRLECRGCEHVWPAPHDMPFVSANRNLIVVGGINEIVGWGEPYEWKNKLRREPIFLHRIREYCVETSQDLKPWKCDRPVDCELWDLYGIAEPSSELCPA
jgi:hypothetical protein